MVVLLCRGAEEGKGLRIGGGGQATQDLMQGEGEAGFDAGGGEDGRRRGETGPQCPLMKGCDDNHLHGLNRRDATWPTAASSTANV